MEVERIALRLFAEHGYGGVTVADVAAAADVSPRTFYRYFASKEDVVLSGIVGRIKRVPIYYRERPVDEPVVEALRHAYSELADAASFAGSPVELDRAAVLGAEPEVARHGLDRLYDTHEDLTAQTSLRMGVDWRLDPRPGIIVAAMSGALRAAWLTAVSTHRISDVPRMTSRSLDLLVPVLTTLVGPPR